MPLNGSTVSDRGFLPQTLHVYIIPTSQRPHLTGDGHTKPILTEAKDQVLLGQTGLVSLPTV